MVKGPGLCAPVTQGSRSWGYSRRQEARPLPTGGQGTQATSRTIHTQHVSRAPCAAGKDEAEEGWKGRGVELEHGVLGEGGQEVHREGTACKGVRATSVPGALADPQGGRWGWGREECVRPRGRWQGPEPAGLLRAVARTLALTLVCFWGVKSYTRIFNRAGGPRPNSHVVQGSTMYFFVFYDLDFFF